MKVNKQQLVIFEKDKDIIKVWEEFFSDDYKLTFMNKDFNQTVDKININSKTIFIYNNDVKTNEINKVNNNMILHLLDKKTVSKFVGYHELRKRKYFIKPISLKDIETVIKEISYNHYLKEHEKIVIKGLLLLPLDRKLLSPVDKEFILLTEKEVSILTELNNTKNIITKEKLLTDIWGYNSEINTTTLETHVHRLRQKLKKFSKKITIKTIKGGYHIE